MLGKYGSVVVGDLVPGMIDDGAAMVKAIKILAVVGQIHKLRREILTLRAKLQQDMKVHAQRVYRYAKRIFI